MTNMINKNNDPQMDAFLSALERQGVTPESNGYFSVKVEGVTPDFIWYESESILQILKAEFHQIRSVVEAYSNRGELHDMANGTACGILLDKGSNWNHIFRVTTAGQTVDYKLDRWD